MKSKALACLFAIVAIVAFWTVPAIAAEPTLPPGHTWYQNDEFKFKIGIPDTWVRTPEESITCTEPTLHVSIFSAPDTSVSTLIMVESSEAIDKFMEELKEYEDVKDVLINGREGYEVIAEGAFPPLKARAVMLVVEDRVYLVRCSCTPDLFDEYETTFDNIISSFIIEYPEPTPEKGELDFPGFEAIVAIAGLLGGAYVVLRGRR